LLFSLWEHVTFLWYTTVISFVISFLLPSSHLLITLQVSIKVYKFLQDNLMW
jgi:hypothetical protein